MLPTNYRHRHVLLVRSPGTASEIPIVPHPGRMTTRRRPRRQPLTSIHCRHELGTATATSTPTLAPAANDNPPPVTASATGTDSTTTAPRSAPPNANASLLETRRRATLTGQAVASGLLFHIFHARRAECLARFAVKAFRVRLFGTLDRLGTPGFLRRLGLRRHLGCRRGRSSRRRCLSERGARTENTHDRRDQ